MAWSPYGVYKGVETKEWRDYVTIVSKGDNPVSYFYFKIRNVHKHEKHQDRICTNLTNNPSINESQEDRWWSTAKKQYLQMSISHPYFQFWANEKHLLELNLGILIFIIPLKVDLCLHEVSTHIIVD